MTLLDADLLDGLAVSLRYPGPSSARVAAAAGEGAATAEPELGQRLTLLGRWLAATDASTTEVWYTQLFELDPHCTLDLGHHLFGESYRRGKLLARLAPEHAEAGVELASELPDHLPALLQLLGRLPSAEDQALLLVHVIMPGLSAVNARLSGSDAPWAAVLAALESGLARLADRFADRFAEKLVPHGTEPDRPTRIVEAPRG